MHNYQATVSRAAGLCASRGWSIQGPLGDRQRELDSLRTSGCSRCEGDYQDCSNVNVGRLLVRVDSS